MTAKGGAGRVRATVPALPGPGGAGAGGGGGGGAAGGGGASKLLRQLLAQGYSMEEVMALAQAKPELMARLFS